MMRNRVKIHSVSSRQAVFVTIAVVFVICSFWLAYQTWRAKAAFDNWFYLKFESRADSKSVEEALALLNDEERNLIPPIVFGFASMVSVLKSINPKVLPRRCVYCGCWMKGKDAKHGPDRLFWYHEACLLKREKKAVQIAVIVPASTIITEK